MFEVIFGIVLLLFAAGGIWAYVVSKKVEALLGDPKQDQLELGSRIRIKYLPDRREYPVLIDIL